MFSGHRESSEQAQFLSDSVDGPGANSSYPKMDLHGVFGEQDSSVAVPQGTLWLNSITKAGSASIPLAPTCMADAPHAIPNVLDGSQQIVDDIKTRWKLQ